MTNKNKTEATALTEEQPVDKTSETVKIDNANPQKEKQAKEDKSSGHMMIYLLLLIVLVLLVGAAYYVKQEQMKYSSQLQQFDQKIQTIAEVNNKIDNIEAKNNVNEESVAKYKQQLEIIAAETEKSKNLAQQALDTINRSQRDWALAEIDYLLRMAHRRLEVSKDVAGAIAALKGADSRVQELNDLKLFKVRKQLAKDIAELSTIKEADVSGVAIAIDQVLVYLPEFPFKSVQSEIQTQLAETESAKVDEVKTETEVSFIDSIINAIKSLGDIKIHRRSVGIVDSVAQEIEIERLLYTHLLGARLSALNYEQNHFVYELEQVEQLLNKHYDVSDNRIEQFLADLSKYKNMQLAPSLPELTKAWDMLQEAMKSPVIKIAQENK